MPLVAILCLDPPDQIFYYISRGEIYDNQVSRRTLECLFPSYVVRGPRTVTLDDYQSHGSIYGTLISIMGMR